MKAAILRQTGGPEVFSIEELPTPDPAPTQVLIKVAACGLCGHDQSDRSGLTHVPLPTILGHEISGTVSGLGEKAVHFQLGDRVACKQFTTCGWCERCRSGQELECPSRSFNYGGYAEYVAIEERSLLAVPAGVDLVGASIVACALGSCVHALEQVAKLEPGEAIAITGAGGGLGLHALQAARFLGATTIAITTSASKQERLKSLGASHVVLADGSEFWRDLLSLTDGAGVDVVLDNVGHPDLFRPCFRALRRRGRYVFTGQVARTKVDFYPAFVFGKEAIITGAGSTRMGEFIRAMELVARGAVAPVVEQFPLSEITEAWRRVDNREVFGRAVVVP